MGIAGWDGMGDEGPRRWLCRMTIISFTVPGVQHLEISEPWLAGVRKPTRLSPGPGARRQAPRCGRWILPPSHGLSLPRSADGNDTNHAPKNTFPLRHSLTAVRSEPYPRFGPSPQIRKRNVTNSGPPRLQGQSRPGCEGAGNTPPAHQP
jgi:hypothetical protein